jgi:hypothetical protein
MTTHSILAIHERNDDKPEPELFVADVVCRCARIFASELHPSAEAARDDARAQYDEHEKRA